MLERYRQFALESFDMLTSPGKWDAVIWAGVATHVAVIAWVVIKLKLWPMFARDRRERP